MAIDEHASRRGRLEIRPSIDHLDHFGTAIADVTIEGLRGFMSQTSIEVLRISLPFASVSKVNRAGVALGGAAGYEMAPRAGMPGLLNRLPLDCELSPEGPSFDGLSKHELLQEPFSVAGRYG